MIESTRELGLGRNRSRVVVGGSILVVDVVIVESKDVSSYMRDHSLHTHAPQDCVECVGG